MNFENYRETDNYGEKIFEKLALLAWLESSIFKEDHLFPLLIIWIVVAPQLIIGKTWLIYVFASSSRNIVISFKIVRRPSNLVLEQSSSTTSLISSGLSSR
ncbi:unnamed protein product [Caenorhabditis nigoni]